MIDSPHSYNAKRRDNIRGFSCPQPTMFEPHEPIEIVTWPPSDSRDGRSGWTVLAWRADHGLVGWHLIGAHGVVSNVSSLSGAGRFPRKATGNWHEEVLEAVAASSDVGQMAWR